MINNSLLVPKRAIYNALGVLCNYPSLLTVEDKSLTKKDFDDILYGVIFTAIEGIMAKNTNVTKITAVDIDNYLADYVKAYKIYEEYNGFEFISDAIERCNKDTYENSREIIRKFSLLRDFNIMGFDISELYDPESLDLVKFNKQQEELMEMELQTIINHFNMKLLELQNEWNIDSEYKTYQVDDGIDDLLERLRATPDFGHPFLNKTYNTIFRGMRFGKLMIKSAGTGVGKTRSALADMVSISCPEIYNVHKDCYEENITTYASTFISTELDKDELQTCLIAIISGVNEDIITEGKYNESELNRIKKAIDIIKRSSMKLHVISDFSISDIERIIEQDILKYDSKFIFFDYLQITPKLVRTTLEEYGMGLREDQVMLNFASRLKHIAEKYEVYVSTATQLNRNSKEWENRDATSIRGGSAQIDKCDHAVQMYRVGAKELAMVEELVRAYGVKPNFIHIVYKNRGGRFNDVVVWTKMNTGNMREEICFVTDKDGEIVEINETDLRKI